MRDLTTQLVAALVADRDRWAFADAARAVGISLVSGRRQLLEMVRAHRVRTVICDTATGAAKDAELLEEIDRNGVRLVLRTAFDQPSVQHVLLTAERVPSVHICPTRGYPTLEPLRAVEAVSKDHDGGPSARVISCLAPNLEPAATRVVLAALVLSRERLTATQLATYLGLAPRTLQSQLQVSGLPRAHRLLVWGAACWAAWRLAHWEMSCKATALAAGFSRTAAMTSVVRRSLGVAPTALGQFIDAEFLARRFLDLQREDRSAALQLTGSAI